MEQRECPFWADACESCAEEDPQKCKLYIEQLKKQEKIDMENYAVDDY